MEIKKRILILTILTVWALSMTAYAVRDIWMDYQVQGVQQAYGAGREETILELIEQTQKSECQIFSVFLGDREAKLLDAECLPKEQGEEIIEQK
jgi:hypothetical protein